MSNQDKVKNDSSIVDKETYWIWEGGRIRTEPHHPYLNSQTHHQKKIKKKKGDKVEEESEETIDSDFTLKSHFLESKIFEISELEVKFLDSCNNTLFVRTCHPNTASENHSSCIAFNLGLPSSLEIKGVIKLRVKRKTTNPYSLTQRGFLSTFIS